MKSRSLDLINLIYTENLEMRQRCIDKENGITTEKKEQTLIRQFPTSNKQNFDAIKLDYLRIFYNYLIAAIRIALIYHVDNESFLDDLNTIKVNITKRYNALYNNHQKDNRFLHCVAEGKGDLLALLTTYLPNLTGEEKKLSVMLDQAKNWVALEQPSLAIQTELTHLLFPDKKIVILDEPCTQLTEAQKNWFKNLDAQAWFNALPEFQQALIKQYKEAILAENRVIPSQLRRVLPLCKNTYRQTIFSLENDNLTPLNTYYHCGTVAYLNNTHEKVAENITKEIVKQQELMCGGQKSILMFCLNSETADSYIAALEKMKGNTDYQGDDSVIVARTKKNINKLANVHFAKICLNFFRHFEDNDYQGLKDTLRLLESNQQRLADKIKDEADCLISKKIRSLVEQIYRKQLFNFFGMIDQEVKGLDIIYLTTQAVTLNNLLVEKYKGAISNLDTIAIWFGCASGENRTGITYYNNICQTLIDHLKLNSCKDKKAIYQLVTDSQHVHFMTSVGGTFGTEGIRYESWHSFKPEHEYARLITKAAGLKSFPAEQAQFNLALKTLKKTLATHPNPWGSRLYWLLKAQQKQFCYLASTTQKAFIKTLTVTNAALANPQNTETFSALCNLIPEFANEKSALFIDHSKASLRKTIIGLLVGLVGGSLIAASVIATLSTFGIMSPISIGGITLGVTILSQSFGILFATGVGASLFAGGSYLTYQGIFRQEVGINTLLKNIIKADARLGHEPQQKLAPV